MTLDHHCPECGYYEWVLALYTRFTGKFLPPPPHTRECSRAKSP